MRDPRLLRFRAIPILLALCLLAAKSASAAYLFDWHFDDPVQTAGPFDTVTMLATLVNESTAGEHILGGDIQAASYTIGNTSLAYNFDFGSFGNFFGQFAGLDLAP